MRRRLALLATLAAALVGVLAIPSTASAETWRSIYLENGHRVCDIAFGLGTADGGWDWYGATAVGRNEWNLNYCENPANGRDFEIWACDAAVDRNGGQVAGNVGFGGYGSCLRQAYGDNVFCWCNFKSRHFVGIDTNGWGRFRDRCGGCMRSQHVGGDYNTTVSYRIWETEIQIWLDDADVG